jgi:hypothetical protein
MQTGLPWENAKEGRRREDNTNPDLTKKWDKVYTRLVSSQRNNHPVSAQCAECPNLLGNSESGKDSAPWSYSVLIQKASVKSIPFFKH